MLQDLQKFLQAKLVLANASLQKSKENSKTEKKHLTCSCNWHFFEHMLLHSPNPLSLLPPWHTVESSSGVSHSAKPTYWVLTISRVLPLPIDPWLLMCTDCRSPETMVSVNLPSARSPRLTAAAGGSPPRGGTRNSAWGWRSDEHCNGNGNGNGQCRI